MTEPAPQPHRRRKRYAGKYPRRFEEKYKELDPAAHPETVAKVLASGKTPAGMHVPIMAEEILAVLRPQPGERMVDGTLGYGGHAARLLPLLQPGGTLLGLDVDPVEQPKTEARLRAAGWGEEALRVHRSNFAGVSKVLGELGWGPVDGFLADLGLSSMQIDTPSRGFSVKTEGPLDMRMNPGKGRPASELLRSVDAETLAGWLRTHADEPRATDLAARLAGREWSTTRQLADAVRAVVPRLPREEQDLTVRRVFQAVRIEVNGEFEALDALLRQIPAVLAPGGRVAFLTFHSGEDRRVKKALEAGRGGGVFAAVSDGPLRPSPAECHRNPRARPAKLRWAVRA